MGPFFSFGNHDCRIIKTVLFDTVEKSVELLDDFEDDVSTGEVLEYGYKLPKLCIRRGLPVVLEKRLERVAGI